MQVVLAYPFRPDGHERAWNFEHVRRCVDTYYDWNYIIQVDSGHKKFNRAATRNLAVNEADKLGADVVVICDADSVPENQPLNDAILGAFQDDKIHYPFDTVYEMIPKATQQIGRQNIEQLKQRAFGKCESEGGIWVTKPSTWRRAGGQDSRFAGWGCEDRAFLAANRTLVGMPVKHPGALFCMYHNRDQNNEDAWDPGEVAILIKYQEAYQNPIDMLKVIYDRAYHEYHEAVTAHERTPSIVILHSKEN